MGTEYVEFHVMASLDETFAARMDADDLSMMVEIQNRKEYVEPLMDTFRTLAVPDAGDDGVRLRFAVLEILPEEARLWYIGEERRSYEGADD